MNQMLTNKPTSDAELEIRKHRRAEAEASLAIEGMYLDPEQKALFDRFDAEGTPMEEQRRIIAERGKRRAQGLPVTG